MNFFEELNQFDTEVANACELELERQRHNIELIASENIVSKAVLLAAGGVLIQLLPFPDDATVNLIERNASELYNISRYFADGLTNEQIAEIALRDVSYDIFDTLEVSYKCDCSRKRMREKILSLGKNEVRKLLDEQESEGKNRDLTAECRFCNNKYTFTEKDLLG